MVKTTCFRFLCENEQNEQTVLNSGQLASSKKCVCENQQEDMLEALKPKSDSLPVYSGHKH